MFDYLKKPKDVTNKNLMYGVPDFSDVGQFDQFEKGYSFLKVVQIAPWLETLASVKNEQYGALIANYKHILEHEFRGLDGLDNITTETYTLTNGIAELNLISKTVKQSAATVSMQYTEKSGAPISKVHELYLTGIKDPVTEAKTYHGLITGSDDDVIEAGAEQEVFIFLYFVTDNTMTKLEKAFLLLSAQPTTAELNMYNSEKGTIENVTLNVEFNCYPVTGNEVDKRALELLKWMNNEKNTTSSRLIRDSDNYKYSAIDKIKVGNENVL